MRVIVIGDSETNVGDIAERLYGGLSAEARQHAEQALLSANPQLAETGALRTGAVIVAPDVSGLAFTPTAGGRDPADELRQGLRTAVAGYREYLSDGLTASREDINHQRELLDARASALQEAGLDSLIEGLFRSLEQREQAVTDAGDARQAMFERLMQDIDDW